MIKITTATLLSTMVGNSFVSSLQTEAITLAESYTGISSGESDTKDMGLALIALKALKTRAQAGEENFPSDFGQLITDEIRDLLYDEKTSTNLTNIFNYKKQDTSQSGFI